MLAESCTHSGLAVSLRFGAVRLFVLMECVG